ncbi:MAG: septum formation initiator [Bacteroidetes bacterium HGW-Bacteroidetes-16]|jgi:cell division protein FtsB|nr:MAG: septum formation initiator [Bacteroidetes bacterium HGW-Bacteroidetes-16]
MFNKRILRNKYFYTGLIFAVWVLFFDQESMLEQCRLSDTLNGLNHQKEYYQDEISQTEKAIKTLENDSVSLEKYARENYYMKKSNEDIYVIVRDKDK